MEIQFNQSIKDLAKADNKKELRPMGLEISALAQARNTAKKELNASILQSAINATSAADQPLTLVLKTVLEGINDALQKSGGEEDIQDSYDSGLDISPHATADRIVLLSTAFFGSYQDQHPELSQAEAVSTFTDIISGGIDTGFEDARKILNGLAVLEGEIASNIELTYDLVQQGLNAFIERFTSNENDA